MGRILRWCRGALGMGITWGVVWGAIFAAIVAVVAQVDPPQVDPGEGPLDVAKIGAMFGFISGVAFAVLLTLTERHKNLADLSLARAALWGAIGTALFPLLTPVNNSMLIFLCPIGAMLAAGSVAMARKALPEDARAELGSGQGPRNAPTGASRST